MWLCHSRSLFFPASTSSQPSCHFPIHRRLVFNADGAALKCAWHVYVLSRIPIVLVHPTRRTGAGSFYVHSLSHGAHVTFISVIQARRASGIFIILLNLMVIFLDLIVSLVIFIIITVFFIVILVISTLSSLSSSPSPSLSLPLSRGHPTVSSIPLTRGEGIGRYGGAQGARSRGWSRNKLDEGATNRRQTRVYWVSASDMQAVPSGYYAIPDIQAVRPSPSTVGMYLCVYVYI
jgi:hypothetical protein